MHQLLTLKNNSKSRKILQSLIADKDPYHWLSETLLTLEKRERKNSLENAAS